MINYKINKKYSSSEGALKQRSIFWCSKYLIMEDILFYLVNSYVYYNKNVFSLSVFLVEFNKKHLV